MKVADNGTRLLKRTLCEQRRIDASDPQLLSLASAYEKKWGVSTPEHIQRNWIGSYFPGESELLAACAYVDFPEQKERDILDIFVAPKRCGKIAAYELLNFIMDNIVSGWRLAGMIVF